MNAIETKHLTMRFGSTVALDDVNLALAPNRIYGL